MIKKLLSDWFSCEKFAERASKNLDGVLPWYDKPAYYFRLFSCRTSRVFHRQMQCAEKICKEYAELENAETDLAADKECCHKMSKSCCEKIRKNLRDEKQVN